MRIARDRPCGLVALLTLSACAAAPDPAQPRAGTRFEAQNREAHARERAGRPRGLRPGGARPTARRCRSRCAAASPTCATTGACPGQVDPVRAPGPAGAASPRSTTRFLVNTHPRPRRRSSTWRRTWGCPTTRPTSTRPSTAGACPRAATASCRCVGPGTQRDWTGYALDQVLDPICYVLPVAALNALLVARRARRRQRPLRARHRCSRRCCTTVRGQLHRAADQLHPEHAGPAAGRHQRRPAGGCLCRPMT